MAETVTMPKLGFDMAEGTLVRWVKAEGDTVNKGDILAEIETDKATVEVESYFSGVMARHLVSEGTPVPVGDPIAIIAAPSEKVEAGPGPQKAEEKPVETAKLEKEEKAPAANTAEQKTVAGSVAAAEIAPPEVQTDAGAPKTTTETYEAGAGPSGATVTGGEQGEAGGTGGLRASPLARRMAQEKGLDLRTIQGSGPGGRIVRKDVEQALKAPRPATAPAAAPAVRPTATMPEAKPAKPAKPAGVPMQPAVFGAAQAPEDERVPVSKLRGAIGRRMVESKQAVPHFYVTTEYNVGAMMAMRKQINELLPDEQKISVNDFIVKAVALTLRQFPNINASLNGSEIVRHGHVNVGVAVSLDNGLMTVVCKDADQKPLRYIAAEIKELVARARSGKVRPDDVEGSTFSISNLGMYEVFEFIAIINPPEAAILAVGSAQQVPVVEDGEIKVAWRMKATISADHRVTDGAEAARFMQSLKTYLENPMLLLV